MSTGPAGYGERLASLEKGSDNVAENIAALHLGLHELKDSVHENLSSIAVLQKDMERILGNGQAGEIEKLTVVMRLEFKGIYAAIEDAKKYADTRAQELHNRISLKFTEAENRVKGVSDAMSVRTWLPILLMGIATVASVVASWVSFSAHHP